MDIRQLLDNWKIKKQQWTLQEKLAAFCLVWIVAIGIFYMIFLSQQQEALQQRKDRLQELTAKNTRLETFKQAHPDLSAYHSELDGNLLTVSLKIPESNDLSGILSQLDQVVRKNNLDLMIVKPGNAINKKDYREIPVELNIKGSFLDTMNLLRDLGQMPRLANVVMVSTQSKQDKLNTKLAVLVYSYGIIPNAVSDNAPKNPPTQPTGTSENLPTNTPEQTTKKNDSSEGGKVSEQGKSVEKSTPTGVKK